MVKNRKPAAPEDPSVSKDEVHIRVPGGTDQKTLGLLKGLIDQCRGEACICLHVECDEGARRIRLGSEYGVAYNETFSLGVQGILGDGAVWVGQ